MIAKNEPILEFYALQISKVWKIFFSILFFKYNI